MGRSGFPDWSVLPEAPAVLQSLARSRLRRRPLLHGFRLFTTYVLASVPSGSSEADKTRLAVRLSDSDTALPLNFNDKDLLTEDMKFSGYVRVLSCLF